MTLPSALVNINSQSQLPNGVNVTDGSTVTIALASTDGVYAWSVECIGTDDQNTTAAVNATLVVHPATFTATFTAPHNADGYGCALIWRSTVNNGVDVNGLVQPYLTTTFGVYVPTFIPTVRLGAQNETVEGNAVYGWLTKINQAIRAGLFTGGFLTGDVNGPAPANLVTFLQGKPLSVSSPSLNNVLTWNGSAWVPQAAQGGILGGDVTGPSASNTVGRIQGISVGVPVTVGNVLQVVPGIGLGWAPLNLAGGSNFVTGTLPAGNQASQTVGGDLSGTTASATVIGLQTRAVASTAPHDGYVLTWVAAHNDWEPFPITTGSVTLLGDVTGAVNNNTVTKFQNRSFSNAAPSNHYVIAWNSGNNDWEPTDPTTLPIVNWNDDLFHSTNNDQFVTAISGFPTTGGDVTIHATSFTVPHGHDFAIQSGAAALNNAAPNISISTGDAQAFGGPGGNFTVTAGSSSTGTGNGGNITLTAGEITGGVTGNTASSVTITAGGVAGLTTVANGGNIHLQGGSFAGSSGAPGFVDINSGGVIATFAYSNITLDTRSSNAASFHVLNSGTGGTTIYSDGYIGITAAGAMGLASATSTITINAHTNTVFEHNGTAVVDVTAAGIQFDGAFNPGSGGANIGYLAGSGNGSALNVIAQGASGSNTGGNLNLGSGFSNSGTVGNVVIKTGMNSSVGSTSGTTQVTVTPTKVTLASLSGSGNNLVSVNNSGDLALAGAFSGDLSGSWPTITVTGIHGVTVPASPSTNQVLVATGSTAAVWELIADANVSATAGISGSKINPNFGTQALTAGNSVLGTLTCNTLTAGSSSSLNAISGAIDFSIETYASNSNVDGYGKDFIILCDTSTIAFTMTLPAPTIGRTLIFKDKKQTFATNNLTIAQHSTEKIDGVAGSLVLNITNQEILLESDGTDWYSNIYSSLPTGAAGGDLSGTYPNPTVIKVHGVAYPASPSTNTVPVVTGANTVTYQLIADANVSATAAIAGTKISPNFGSQNIVTSGNLTISSLSTGVVHSDSSGNFTSSLIVNADVSSSAAIAVNKLAAGTAAQVLLNNSTPTPTWTTLTGDVTVSATGATTVNSISGSTPIAITPSEFQWKNSTSTPLLDQASLAATNSPTAGQTFTVQAQAGSNALSGNNNGGTGGLLNLSSGVAGAHTGSGADGSPGDLNLQTGAATVLTVSGGSYGTLAFYKSSFPLITQTTANATNTPAAGANMVVFAQQGTSAINGNTNSGNGGDLNLSSGGPGTPSGSGTSGVAGNLHLQTNGTTRLTVSPSNITIPAFSSAGVVHNDSSGNLSSSLIVNADIGSSAAISVSKLSPGTDAQFLINNSTPTPTWVSMSGDVSLTDTGATTVIGIRGKTLASSLASVAAAQDGYVLTWVNAHSDWEAKPQTGGGGGSVTWADDLVNSTSTDQWVAAISGNGGAGGTVPLNITTLQFASGQSSPTINQASVSSGAGQDMTIQAQNVTGGASDAGDLAISGGVGSGGAINGYVQFKYGGNNQARMANIWLWDIANASPSFTQDDQTSGNAVNLQVRAQNTTDSSSAHNGGNLLLIGGAGAGGGTHGSVKLQTGSSPTTRVVVDGSGNVQFNHYGTGVILSDSSGNLTSVVGTNGQVLTVSGGVPTWGSSSGVTWANDLSGNGTTTSTNQYVSSLSYSSAAAGGTIAINGTSTVLQWASGATPLINQAAPASSSGAGTAGTASAITAQTGGATTGSATTAGAGGDYDINSGTGGSGSGGTNASGGAGGNIVLTPGAGGAKSGTGTAGAAGTIKLAGSQNVVVSGAKTANYTIAKGDYVIRIGSLSGAITITLPASPSTGDTYKIKCSSTVSTTNTVTVSPSSGNIDGQSSFVLMTPYDAIECVYNGSEWSVL